jgi:hypothetical protein
LLHEIVACVTEYHRRSGGDDSYDRYFAGPHPALADPLDRLDAGSVAPVVQFLRDWRARSHYQSHPEALLDVLRRVWPGLQALRTSSLLSADLTVSSDVASTVSAVFDCVAGSAPVSQPVASSKLLHALHPELFVMWDSAVMAFLNRQCRLRGALRREGGYLLFLRMMQDIALRAVGECAEAYGVDSEAALARLCPCGHSLAKVIDEYNIIRLRRADRAGGAPSDRVSHSGQKPAMP